MRRKCRTAGAFAGVVALLLSGCAELGLEMAGRSKPDPLDAAAGLKEALRVGSQRSVTRAARPGGFLDHPRLRIPLPDALETTASGMRTLGIRSPAEDLEVAMNRAAERAAGEATGVFWSEIDALTIQDPGELIRGPDTAATSYLRGRAETALRSRFAPIVTAAMQEVGVYRTYDAFLSRTRRLDLVPSPDLDLERYVTDAALDGLFVLLAEEEQRIRDEPAARTTELLRQVFGTG